MELNLTGDNSSLDRALRKTQEVLGQVQNATSMTERELRTLERQAASASTGLDKVSRSLSSSGQAARAARTGLSAYSGAALAAVTALQRLEAQQRKVTNKELGALSLPTTINRDPVTQQFRTPDIKNLSDNDLASVVRAMELQQETLTSVVRKESARRQAIIAAENAAAAARTREVGSRNYNNTSVQIDDAIAQRAREAQEFSRALQGNKEAFNGAGEANQAYIRGLASTRYALYDVSQTIGITSVALAALAVAPAATAIAFERNFADVARTSGATGSALSDLSDEFIGLAQTLPVPFEDLTQIGALGGQLGIAAGGLDEFTSVVARLTATTDLSAEAAGTALGRFKALLGTSDSEFEALGSAILKVGVNSVATETQIVNIATQIAGMGAFAGMTEAQVIGLSGALASVGVPPELSRGIITRLFTNISSAVAEGGTTLENFARVAGVSATTFHDSWGTPQFAGIMTKLMEGIGNQGGAAVDTLHALGATGDRDVPVLLRLANASSSTGEAFGLMAEQMNNSQSGWDDASTLASQYGVIAETTAASLQILGNRFQVMLAAMGASTTGPIKITAEALGDLFDNITKLANDPFWGEGITFIGVFAGLAAAAGLATAAVLAGLGGYAALITAMQGLQAHAGGAGLSMASLNTMLAATGPAGAKAAFAIEKVGLALKALSVIGALLVLPDLAKWSNNIANDMMGIDAGPLAAMDRIKEGSQSLDNILNNSKWMNDARRGGADIFGTIGTDAVGDIKAIDDELARLASNGNLTAAKEGFDVFAQAIRAHGGALSDAQNLLPEYGKALTTVSEGTKGFTGDLAARKAAEEQAAQVALEDAEALQALLGAYAEADAALVDGAGAWQLMIDRQRAVAEAAADSSKSTKDSWQDFFDDSAINLQGYLENLNTMVENQEQWERNMILLSGRVSDGTLQYLRDMGEQGVPLVAALVNGSDEELSRFEGLAAQAGAEGTGAFANTINGSAAVIRAASAQLGNNAALEIAQKLADGTSNVQDIINDYGLVIEGMKPTLKVDSKFDPFKAELEMHNFLTRNSGKSVTVTVVAKWIEQGRPNLGARTVNGVMQPGLATGGPVYGPGSGTSDSILTRLSNGEYVVKAKAVKRYGLGFLEDINNMRAKRFATGGHVGNTPTPAPSSSVTMVELSPYDRGLLERLGNTQVVMDGRVVAQATNANNLGAQQRGK